MRHLIVILGLLITAAAPGFAGEYEGTETIASVGIAQASGEEHGAVAAASTEAQPSDESEDSSPTPEGAGQTAAPKGWYISDWNISGRLDYQFMRMNASGADPMEENRGMLMAAELETTAAVNNGERDVLDVALQWPYATQMKGVDGRGREMHFGNAYAIYKMGLGKPNIRFGRFVMPFGNLTYYETHTRPLQTLYPQSLGVRIDRGVSLEGFKGSYDYWLAVMGGNGGRADNNGSPAWVGRIARRFDLENGGTVTGGFSALYGTHMPRFSPLVDPVMDEAMMDMPVEHSLTFTDKTRAGLDLEYNIGRSTWRAELVGGRDSDGAVNGQFLQWNRAISEKTEITAQVARWEQPGGNRLRLGASYTRKLDESTIIRSTVERSLGHIPGEERNETVLSVQLAREFSGLLGK